MAKTYKKKIIGLDEKERLYQKYLSKIKNERKADVSGATIHLYTDTSKWIRQWDMNWFPSDKNLRSHGKIIAVDTGKGKPRVLYDPISNTLFFLDTKYYGWIKSSVLALTGDILEDNHNIFSAHSALVEVAGKGAMIMGPPKSGKTTLSYGLLRYKNTKLVTDDWLFFNFIKSKPTAYAGEKNTYIGKELGDIWKEFRKPLRNLEFDNHNRVIVDVRKIVGAKNVTRTTKIKTIILLKRKKGEPIVKKLTTNKALKYLEDGQYFNPHTLQKTPWKKKVRRAAFKRLLDNCNVYLLNTIETQEKTLDRLCDLAGLKKKLKRF